MFKLESNHGELLPPHPRISTMDSDRDGSLSQMNVLYIS